MFDKHLKNSILIYIGVDAKVGNFLEPNSFSVERNELTVSVQNGNLFLNGIMLNDTTCQLIRVRVHRATEYIHGSGEFIR